MTHVAQEETFPGTPEPLTPAQSALVPEKVQKLLGVFVDRGFVIKACILLPGLCLQHCWGSHVISKHVNFSSGAIYVLAAFACCVPLLRVEIHRAS